jgi:hypothetical protein
MSCIVSKKITHVVQTIGSWCLTVTNMALMGILNIDVRFLIWIWREYNIIQAKKLVDFTHKEISEFYCSDQSIFLFYVPKLLVVCKSTVSYRQAPRTSMSWDCGWREEEQDNRNKDVAWVVGRRRGWEQ